MVSTCLSRVGGGSRGAGTPHRPLPGDGVPAGPPARPLAGHRHCRHRHSCTRCRHEWFSASVSCGGAEMPVRSASSGHLLSPRYFSLERCPASLINSAEPVRRPQGLSACHSGHPCGSHDQERVTPPLDGFLSRVSAGGTERGRCPSPPTAVETHVNHSSLSLAECTAFG